MNESPYPLLGTRIVLNEEKIINEGKYNIEEIYRIIDNFAKDLDLIKIDKYTYHCKGNKEDLSNLGLFIFEGLMEAKWFTLNVKEWEWISEIEGNQNLIGDKLGIWEE